MTRYIFVTGGVVSSLGKGLAAASIGVLLQGRGYKVRIRKFDPYLNVDPGTMSPYQHGEVYVTDDGAETDLDLGHYERFTGVDGVRSDSITSGRIYASVIAKERRGDYLGATVQVIPHVTDYIKESIRADLDPDLDFLICEVGGTVGDIEGLPFLEAMRQFSGEESPASCLFIHLTLVPYIASADELKTKPSQHSVKELLHLGIQPHMLLCRCDRPIPAEAKRKLALFCNIKPECVIEALDLETIYDVPLSYADLGFDEQILRYFGMVGIQDLDLTPWKTLSNHIRNPKGTVRIALVGKYTALKDAYKSLNEALSHGGIAHQLNVVIDWIDSESDDLTARLGRAQGILVPGGYGVRGTPGMITAIEFARKNQVPFLGICFGMQLSIIETLRAIGGIPDASSTEFGDTSEPVIGLLTEWARNGVQQTRDAGGDMGGTMRLGAYPCVVTKNTLAHAIYGNDQIFERHRHRYEANLDYEEKLRAGGMIVTGRSPDGSLPEIIERTDHPWFLGVQFHPELKSRPLSPHPLFVSYIKAARDYGQTFDLKEKTA